MRASCVCVLAWVAMSVVACADYEPMGLPGPPARLEVIGRDTLIVHEMALFEVTATSARGEPVPLPTNPVFDSSDSTVATVSSSGVVTAHKRGRVTIGVSSEALRAEVDVWVRARVGITPKYTYRPCYSCDGDRVAFSPYFGEHAWHLALGDTLHFAAEYVDVDGLPIGEGAAVTWTSSSPSDVSVSAEGDVVGLAWPGPAAAVDVVASTPDGVDSAQVRTVNSVAGQPATLQLAHAAITLGPVTFYHNRGEPVTLSFGESVDIPIASGLFFLDTDHGMSPPSPFGDPHSFGAIVQSGDRLSIFLEGGGPGFVAGVWDVPVVVPGDSVRIRLLQGGTSAGVVYMLAPDAPAQGAPLLCYFDPYDWWGYGTRPVGDIDFVLRNKYGSPFSLRLRESPPAGRSITYVLIESAEHPLSIIAFEDP